MGTIINSSTTYSSPIKERRFAIELYIGITLAVAFAMLIAYGVGQLKSVKSYSPDASQEISKPDATSK